MLIHFLRRLSVQRRIVGSFVILLLFLTLSIPLITTNQLALTSRVQQLANVDAKSDRLLLSALSRILSSRVNLMRYTDDLTASPSEALADVKSAIQSIEEARSLISSPEQKTAIANTLAGLVSYSTLITDVQSARVQNAQQDVAPLLSNSYQLEFNLEQQIKAVVAKNELNIDKTNSTVLAQAQQRLILLVVSYVGILVLAIGMAIAVTQSVTRPISELRQGAEEFLSSRKGTSIAADGTDELSLLARTFNETTAELAQTLAGLEQRVEERTHALAASAGVSRSLSKILDQRQLVAEVVEQLKSSFGYYHVHIYLRDEPSGDLVVAGGTGEAGKIMSEQGHRLSKGKGLVGRAAETMEVILVPDTRQDPNWLPNPLLPDTQSEMAVPILIGETVLGVLDVQNDITGSLSQQDAALIRSIADQVAISLQNVRQHAQTQKRAAELASVAEVSTAASRELNVQKMLETAVHLIQRRFGLYHAHVFLYDENTTVLKIAACGWKKGDVHEGTHGTAAIPIGEEQSLVARAGRTRQAVIVNDVHNEAGWLPNPLLPDTASEMAVPLLVGDQFLGVLDVQSDRLNAFSEADANIQATLASQLAATLENNRSFAESRRRAEIESMLNSITSKIQSAPTIEAALKVTARELGHALGMKPTRVTLDAAASDGTNKGIKE